MSIEKLSNHYSFTNPASVYDEEALTALELAGRHGAKINELITNFNSLENQTTEKLKEQNNKLNEQNNQLNEFKNETIPSEVNKQINENVSNGTFNHAISEYAGGIESRLNNLFENTPEGGTTLDAEVIDIRTDKDGFNHDSAGSSVRHQTKVIEELAKDIFHGHGVYEMPLIWAHSSNSNYFHATPFKIPEHGMSVRVVNFGPFTHNKKECKLMARTYLGYMVNGVFTEDDELNSQYTNAKYTNMTHYIPYMEGVYARVTLTLISDGSNALTNGDTVTLSYLKDYLKVYTGKLESGGNLMGVCVSTLLTGTSLSESEEKEQWKAQWTASNWIYKNSALTTPLPLEYVNRVCCEPDMWLTAKVYKFNPITRKDEWVETIAFNTQHPCFGSECVLDFSKYGKGYFAQLAFGRVPFFYEYQSVGYNGGTTGTSNVGVLGIDPDIRNKVYVEWANGVNIQRTAPILSQAVQKNLELLKLPHKIVAGMTPDAANTYRYALPQNDFAGTFYSGTYTRGTLFYHVSPATYFASLLNPNSCAYGDSNIDESGGRYGTVCATFCSLLHGYPLPLSVCDMRDNFTIPFFERKRINLKKDVHTLKGGDILTDESGGTGHSVMVTGVSSVGDTYMGVNILEAVNPATRESLFLMHNAPRFVKANAENYYATEYTYVQLTDPVYDTELWDKANWNPHYTEPQKVMCSRGYGGVYVDGVNQIILSVGMDVSTINITVNGGVIGDYDAEALSTEEKNGYRLVNITQLVGVGTVRIKNNLDDSVEEFYIIDASDYSVSAELNDNTLSIMTNHPEKVKYVNVHYCYVDGEYAGQRPNMNFMPNFNNGVMTLPNIIETDIGTLSMTEHASRDMDFKDLVNVIFVTEHDTNTFAVDAQGDVFN